MKRDEPTYIVLQKELLRQIATGVYSAGAKLPPLRELAERFGVNYGTIAKAVRRLADEGVVSSEVGRGTFVRPGPGERGHRRIAVGFQDVFFNQTFSHSVAPFILNGLKRVFGQFEWDTIVLSHPTERLGPDILGGLGGDKYDGMLLYNTPMREEEVRRLQRSRVPVVCIGAPWWPMGRVPRVYDARNVIFRQIYTHLAELGHERIACALFTSSATGREQAALARELAEGRGSAASEELCAWIDNRGACAFSLDFGPVFEMLAREAPTALIVPDEVTATQVFNWCFRTGVRVPGDLSLAAVSDLTPRAHPVPLSATDGAATAVTLAEVAAGLLRRLIEGGREEVAAETVIVRDFAWRESVAPPGRVRAVFGKV